MASILFTLLFFIIPTAVFIWFIVALILFLTTPKEDVEKRRTRKTIMIIPAIICGVMLVAVAALAVLFSLAITHM